uniref:Chemokine interleukin-8-like domain-containing protein n=1 Tax=Cyprinus carpio TaxID=7962 RepID=A0A8C2QAD3_CYPCA
MKFTLFAAFIFSVGWMSVVEAAANIVDYFIQEPVLCPVRAVRFQTKKNIVICSDPDSKWAKKVMGRVDRRKTTTKPTTCYTNLSQDKKKLTTHFSVN